jgi:hypothetical protein
MRQVALEFQTTLYRHLRSEVPKLFIVPPRGTYWMPGSSGGGIEVRQDVPSLRRVYGDVVTKGLADTGYGLMVYSSLYWSELGRS